MRCVINAIWTSGLPVSPGFVPYLAIISCLTDASNGIIFPLGRVMVSVKRPLNGHEIWGARPEFVFPKGNSHRGIDEIAISRKALIYRLSRNALICSRACATSRFMAAINSGIPENATIPRI